MIGKQTARAMNGSCNSRGDRLVDGERASTAMVRGGGGLVWFPVLTFGVVAFPFSLAFAGLVTVSLSSC